MNCLSFGLLKLDCFCIELRLFISEKLLQIIDCYVFLLWKFVLYWTSLLLFQFLFEVNFLSLNLIILKFYLLCFSFFFADIIKHRLIFFLHHKRKILLEIRYKWTLILNRCSIHRNITVSFYSWLILSLCVFSWLLFKSSKLLFDGV